MTKFRSVISQLSNWLQLHRRAKLFIFLREQVFEPSHQKFGRYAWVASSPPGWEQLAACSKREAKVRSLENARARCTAWESLVKKIFTRHCQGSSTALHFGWLKSGYLRMAGVKMRNSPEINGKDCLALKWKEKEDRRAFHRRLRLYLKF